MSGKLRAALVDELSTLYESEGQIRPVVDSICSEAMGKIDFSGSANEVWSKVVTELEKRDKLVPLVEQVLKEYSDGPNTKSLQSILTKLSKTVESVLS